MGATHRQVPPSSGIAALPPIALLLFLALALVPVACEQELGRVEELERELNVHLHSEGFPKESPQGVMYQDYFPTTPLQPLPDDTHLDTYNVTSIAHVRIVAAQMEVLIPRVLALPSFLPVIETYIRRIDEAEKFLDDECGTRG